MQVILSIDI